MLRGYDKILFSMAVITITVSPMLHENQERIRVDIPYDPVMIQKIRTVSGARWSAVHRCLTVKGYSWRTVKAYKNCFRQFIRHYDEIKPSQITRKQIDEYVVGLIREKRISESHQNQILSAIKMFYAEVIQQENHRIFIRAGRGKKDRCSILSEKIFAKLSEYFDVYRPVEWVFEGDQGGQYSARSVQKVFTMAKEQSKINPYATVHTLRHS